MSEVEDVMIVETRQRKQQQAFAAVPQAFHPEQFGLDIKSLTSLKQAVLDAVAVDAERIARLRQELASGLYHISSDAIAERMLRL